MKPAWRYTVGLLALVVVGAVVLIYKLMDRRVIDPVEKADARAAEEEKQRAAAVKAASTTLKRDTDQIRAKADAIDAKDNHDAAQRVEELTSDRQRLAEAAARVGRGEPQ